MPETLTAAEIAQNYSAAGDSVTLINELVALSERTDEQVDTVRRNDRRAWVAALPSAKSCS